jgi:hypothetical protein
VHGLLLYDYAILRVVPRVEREEFVNVGVILSCPGKKFLQTGVELNKERLLALDRSLDLDLVSTQLAIYPLICTGGEDAGPIGTLTQRERFNWLVSPKSTIIQTSPVHTGWCQDPALMLEHLLNTMVRTPAPR